MKKEQLFSSAPVEKAIIALAIPTVISQLITVIYNMADTFFIGQLSDPNQVAAATLAMPVFMFLTAFANLFGIGGASTISRFLGAKEYDKAKQTSAFCIYSFIFFALCYGILVILFIDKILPILGADQNTYSFCSAYLFYTVGLGAVPTVFNAGIAHLIRSEGYSVQASVGVALGGILNIILDPIFIFVFKLDITGAAIATMLSNCIAALYFILFLYSIRQDTTITLSFNSFSLKGRIPLEVISTGLPSFIMTLMSTCSNLTLNKIIAGYSNEAVAGMGIAKKIDLMAFAIAQGMTQGALPLIAYNYTAKNKERMMKSLKVLLMDCFVLALIGTGVMFFFAKPITHCFIKDNATVEFGRTFLKIVCLACPTTALNFLAITVFQATGKKVQPLILSLLRKGGLDIPLMLLLNMTIGIQGIAWATPIADGLALIVSIALIVPYLKKLKVA